MVEVKNLVKQYGNGKISVKALKGVSFKLPDKGFVFIVGKSGSGKSTLLNCLGGLDDTTKGEILVNGVDICKLKPHQLDNYRNYFVGIVYQHFNLFEEESVVNNIKIASDIADHKISDEEIINMLLRLDLSDKRDSLVRELSGGQKQRVAIARALIKNPHMILADEPTGNLDSKTSKLIFNTLQEISKSKLVVVISHDMNNAKDYADRIIELSDGKVINDVIRNQAFDKKDQGKLVVSEDTDISNEQLMELNNVLARKGITLYKRDDKFIQNNEVISSSEPKANFDGRNRSWKNTLKLTWNFIKTSKASLIVAIVVSTIIVGLLSLAHGFATYDGASAINEVIERYDSKNTIYNKGYSFTDNVKDLNKKFTIEVNDNDMTALKNTTYDGSIYPIYSMSICYTAEDLFSGMIPDDEKLKSIYTDNIYGVMNIDASYLTKVFGNYELVGGSMYGLETSTDVVITDYMADSLLVSGKATRKDGLPIYSLDPEDPYQGLLGSVLSSRLKVAAVIKTDYKEKYKLMYQIEEKMKKEPQNAGEIAKEFYSSDLFQRFVDQVKSEYAFAYTLNPNFTNDYLESDICDFAYIRTLIVNNDKNENLGVYASKYTIHLNDDLADDEIEINSSLYSSYFPEDTGEDKYITLQNFGFEQNSSETPRYHKRYKVVGTFKDSSSTRLFHVNKNELKNYQKMMIAPYALCFDKVESSYPINTVATSRFFYTSLLSFTAVFNLIDIVNIFSKIFLFIALFLLLLVTLVIVSHNLRTIRKNQYKLGVYKSLGYSSLALSESTLLTSLFMIVLIFGLSIAFTYFLSSVMNSLLAVAFVEFLGSEVYSGLTLISFSMPILSIYIGIVAGLAILSTFIPVISIRKIKPNIIINKAE